jgi:prophage antirepressor-like protein
MIAILEKYNCRMIYNESEEWFHAGDVGKILELTNIRNVLPRIDAEYKRKFSDSIVQETYNRNFDSRISNTGEIFLKPHAVYNVAFRSNKPEGREFTKWVTEVVEFVRRNGFYISTEKDEKWFGVRKESKQVRNSETDSIKEFVEYAKQQGSGKSQMYYKHFTTLVYKKIGVPSGLKRDEMTQDNLLDIMMYERLISKKLIKLIDDDMHYKDVYQKIKDLISEI